MGTYTSFVCQRRTPNGWENVEPTNHGWDPEHPCCYGKLDQMRALNDHEFNRLNPRFHTRVQSFQSPGEFEEPEYIAPWSGRFLPEDCTRAELEEFLDFDYAETISWATIDEVLAFDFSFIENHIGTGYRKWFEVLKSLGVDRVIYGNS